MADALELPAADPGRNHEEGRLVRAHLEHARSQVAAAIGLQNSRITFTSGLAESVRTVLANLQQRSPGVTVVSAVERETFHASAAALGTSTVVRVDAEGFLDLEELNTALQRSPAALCCQWANQEVGTIQPIEEISELAASHGVPLIVDATAAGRLQPAPWMAAAWVLLSSEGLGGPPGIGAITVPQGHVLRPLLLGGAQERGRRASLEAILLALGFGAAAEENAGARAEESTRLAALTNRLVDAARAIGGVTRIGPSAPRDRLPDVVCLEVEGVSSEAIVVGLDRRGVAAHSGAACASETFEPSPVLLAMGLDVEHSVRLSVSWKNDESEVAEFGERFAAAVDELRALR